MIGSAASAAADQGKPVSAARLGAVIGVSERAVRELGRLGRVPRLPDGTYPLRAAVRAYCAFLRDAAAGRGGTGATSGLARERARLIREQADRAELANAATRRELVPAAEVEAEWARVCVGLRTRVLAVPSRVHQHLPHLTPAEVAAVDREVRDALTELGKPPHGS